MEIHNKYKYSVVRILNMCSDTISSDYFNIVKNTKSGSEAFTTYNEEWIKCYTEDELWNYDPVLKNCRNLPK